MPSSPTKEIPSRPMNKISATGTRTWVARVRAEYPNQLDYSGVAIILALTLNV